MKSVHRDQIMYKIFVLIFILSTAMAYEDCGSKTGQVTDVSIEGCTPDATCILKRGGNATVHIQFVAVQGTRSIASVVHGVIQGVTVPFHFPYPDGCAYGGLQCPLVANQSYTYSATLPIKRIYPAIRVKIQWELQNENGSDIICVQIPAKIK